jgi:general secretion pathway protein J
VSALHRRRRSERGLTLLEVLVATAILSLVATMIWVSFDQTAKMRVKLTERQEHDHYARVAMARITRDLRAAFLSLHVNQEQRLAATITVFKGRAGLGGAQLDFTTFTHRRLHRGAHEGDACEVGYKLLEHRGDDNLEGMDLVRRESPRIDNDPEHGGVLDVLVPGVRSFEVRFYDDATDQWVDQWDSTQATGQAGRLPPRVRVTLSVEEGPTHEERIYTTETSLYLTRPLTFGLPIY